MEGLNQFKLTNKDKVVCYCRIFILTWKAKGPLPLQEHQLQCCLRYKKKNAVIDRIVAIHGFPM